MIAVIVLGLAYGIAGLTGAAQRGSALDNVRTTSGPLTIQAQLLYRSLSDADATAAAAFLSSGAEPADLRQRYENDIAAASSALIAASIGSDGHQPRLAEISAQLPVYTGLIETARANNRLGLPLGAAYLREASTLMRQTLLPDAGRLYESETVRLADDRGDAAGFPWLAVPFGVILLAVLLMAQQYLTRRTHRMVNPGLAGATLAVLVSLIWVVVAWAGVSSHLHAARNNGSAQVELLAQARIATLQARADEALTLVARGSGGEFEDDFKASMTSLIGEDNTGGLLATAGGRATDPVIRAAVTSAIGGLQRWKAIHISIRAADDGGDYPGAVKQAIGTDPGGASVAFNKVDVDLGRGIDTANATFAREARSADRSLGGLGIAIAVLTVIALAAGTAGFQRRIAEYR